MRFEALRVAIGERDGLESVFLWRPAVLGGRSTVGHVALDHVIGVRIPASQPIIPFSPKNLRVHSVGGAQLVPLAFDCGRLSSSRIVESSDAGVRCEYRWVIARL